MSVHQTWESIFSLAMKVDFALCDGKIGRFLRLSFREDYGEEVPVCFVSLPRGALQRRLVGRSDGRARLGRSERAYDC